MSQDRPLSVLVTGATGAVGPRIVERLASSDCHIRTFSLTVADPGVLPEGVEAIVGDVTDPTAVRSAAEGVDVIFHLAALLHIVNPPPALAPRYQSVNVGGTANVVNAALDAGVKRVVFFSTISVYGPTPGKIVTEEDAPNPDTLYAESKLAAEKIVLEATREDGEPLGTVLRLGAVYGSRIKGNYQRLLDAVAGRRFVPIGRGLNRRTLVYEKDVAEAAVIAMAHPDAAGGIFNVTDGDFHTVSEIVTAICTALGQAPPRIFLPAGPVRFVAGLLEDVGELTGWTSPISRMTVDKYLEDVAVCGRLVQDVLGFTPRHSLQAGWRETVAEMRSSGEL